MAIEATLIDPPRAAIFATISATHIDPISSGCRAPTDALSSGTRALIKLDDEGLMAHERRIYDFTGVLVQIGVLRAKPAKP